MTTVLEQKSKVQTFSFAQDPYKIYGERKSESPKTPNSTKSRQSATQRLETLQEEVTKLKAQEAQLRDLMRQVSEKGANSMLHANGGIPDIQTNAQSLEDIVEQYNIAQNTRKFAQSLQELMGVLKLLEKQIRGIEQCEAVGDLQGFVQAVNQAVNSHNTAAAQCDSIGQLETADLPDLLLQQSLSTHKRASRDMGRLLEGLKRVLKKELRKINWPPPLLKSNDSPSKPARLNIGENGGQNQWNGFSHVDPQALQNIIHMLSTMTSFQRSVQRASFEEVLKPESGEEPPELWAMAAMTDPLIRKLHYLFVQDPEKNAENHPEWLFHIAAKVAKTYSPDMRGLDAFLKIHGIDKIYDLRFEFARCIRSGVQKILKDHHLPIMQAEGKRVLWLNFVEKAIDFEKQIAVLMGLNSRPQGQLGKYGWREGSCFATICSRKDYRESWWEAERSETSQEIEEALKGHNQWLPTHQTRGYPLPEGFETDEFEAGNKEAYQLEHWPPLIAEVMLEALNKLSSKVGLLPDSMVQEFTHATAQRLLKDLRKSMDAELRHLEEFDNELSSEGLKIMGGILCGAHYLESNLQDANSPLIVFDGSDLDDKDAISIMASEGDSFARLRKKGTLQAAKCISTAFRKGASSYFNPKHLKIFSEQGTPDLRPEFPSHSLMKPIEILSYHLELLSKVVDSVVFKEAWKCVAEVLNRLIYNKLVMETQFSLQGGQQLQTDVTFLSEVFAQYSQRSQIYFIDSLNAAKIFMLDEEIANEAARCIGRDSTKSPEPLKKLGIKLRPDKVVFTLTQRL